MKKDCVHNQDGPCCAYDPLDFECPCLYYKTNNDCPAARSKCDFYIKDDHGQFCSRHGLHLPMSEAIKRCNEDVKAADHQLVMDLKRGEI